MPKEDILSEVLEHREVREPFSSESRTKCSCREHSAKRQLDDESWLADEVCHHARLRGSNLCLNAQSINNDVADFPGGTALFFVWSCERLGVV